MCSSKIRMSLLFLQVCRSVSAMDALQWMGAIRMRVNGCSAVNGCRQNESQWMLCSEWVPSEWESMDALQWMGAVRMRVNGCSAVNGCRQNESQWMLCGEWVPSEWETHHSNPSVNIRRRQKQIFEWIKGRKLKLILYYYSHFFADAALIFCFAFAQF